MGVINKMGFCLAAFASVAWADRAVIHREVLDTCYIAPATEWHESVLGRMGDKNDNSNPCNDGYYSAQSLTYAYQIRSKVLLVIENDSGPATTDTVTETAPNWVNYSQQVSCETRDGFAHHAKEYFDDVVKYQLQPLCGS